MTDWVSQGARLAAREWEPEQPVQSKFDLTSLPNSAPVEVGVVVDDQPQSSQLSPRGELGRGSLNVLNPHDHLPLADGPNSTLSISRPGELHRLVVRAALAPCRSARRVPPGFVRRPTSPAAFLGESSTPVKHKNSALTISVEQRRFLSQLIIAWSPLLARRWTTTHQPPALPQLLSGLPSKTRKKKDWSTAKRLPSLRRSPQSISTSLSPIPSARSTWPTILHRLLLSRLLVCFHRFPYQVRASTCYRPLDGVFCR